jgi:hypothetical protein
MSCWSATALKSDDRELMLGLCDTARQGAAGPPSRCSRDRAVVRRQAIKNRRIRRLARAYLSDGSAPSTRLDKAFRIEPGNVQMLRELGDVSVKLGD